MGSGRGGQKGIKKGGGRAVAVERDDVGRWKVVKGNEETILTEPCSKKVQGK